MTWAILVTFQNLGGFLSKFSKKHHSNCAILSYLVLVIYPGICLFLGYNTNEQVRNSATVNHRNMSNFKFHFVSEKVREYAIFGKVLEKTHPSFCHIFCVHKVSIDNCLPRTTASTFKFCRTYNGEWRSERLKDMIDLANALSCVRWNCSSELIIFLNLS